MQTTHKKVKIVPYDNTADLKFELAKSMILNLLGEVEVVHRGASSLKISGQDEIDVYIPVDKEDFIKYLKILTDSFGNPRNTDYSQRIRFAINTAGKNIDLFLIDKECKDWKSGVAFEKYLKEHQDILNEYDSFKKSLDGVSMEEYHQRKDAFIFSIKSENNL